MKKLLALSALLFIASAFMCLARSQEGSNATYKNPRAAIPDRVKDLLGKMTVEEKVAQLQSGVNMPAIAPQELALFKKDQLNEDSMKQTVGKGEDR